MTVCATSTDATFNAPNLLDAPDYTKSDKQEAMKYAIDYVISHPHSIEDVLSGEFGSNRRLIDILSAIAHGRNLFYWHEEFKKELASKLTVRIDARYEVELEALYDQ